MSVNLAVNPSLTITAQAERAMSMWPNANEADPRPALGERYVRVAPVAPKNPVVPEAAPGALRLPVISMNATYPPEPWHLRGQLHGSLFAVPLADVPVDLPPGCRPVHVGGKGVVGAVWVSYEPGGVLSYRELMTTLLVRRGLRLMPTITHIWVDSVASRDGGRALWGIPKGTGLVRLRRRAPFGARRRRSAGDRRGPSDGAAAGTLAGAIPDRAGAGRTGKDQPGALDRDRRAGRGELRGRPERPARVPCRAAAVRVVQSR